MDMRTEEILWKGIVWKVDFEKDPFIIHSIRPKGSDNLWFHEIFDGLIKTLEEELKEEL